tara:strand:- start:69 stop:488 length:420 start_codon:yes stop_codon:yes gene_type:complete
MSEEPSENDYDAKALIIQPEEVFTPHICCDNCGLEYSKEDYAILFENKKLVFVHTSDNVAEKENIDFRIDYILCQQCVFTLSKNLHPDRPSKVLIVDAKKNKGYTCTFDPDDIKDEEIYYGDGDISEFFEDEDEDADLL